MDGDERDEAGQDTFHVTATVKRAIGDADRRHCRYPEAETDQPTWHEWLRTVAAVIGACIAAWALKVSYDALTVNTRAMQSINRAWVLLDNQQRSRFTQSGAAFSLRNFGRSPATIAVIHPGMSFNVPMPDHWEVVIDGQAVPGPVPERVVAPDRELRVRLRWTESPKVRPYEMNLRIEYADSFDVYEYRLCLRPRAHGSRMLVECPYNQRTEKNRYPFRPLE